MFHRVRSALSDTAAVRSPPGFLVSLVSRTRQQAQQMVMFILIPVILAQLWRRALLAHGEAALKTGATLFAKTVIV